MNWTKCYNMENTELTAQIEQLLDNMKDIKSKLDSYNIRKESLKSNINSLSLDLETLRQRKHLIDSAKQYYLKVIDVCYMHSIKEMEDFVNKVLGYVFYDEQYSIRLDITNKHNKSITFYLIDGRRDIEIPLRKGCGKGIKSVVSFILLTYYLMRMKSPYLFLDESFVNISAGYVSRFFEYVKLLCHKHNMCIVLITHDPRFKDFADFIYNVKNGVVTRSDK